MLKNSYYVIDSVNKTGNNVKAKLRVNKDHVLTKAHFPGTPVIPGVCLIQILLEVLEEALNKKLALVKASTIKFLEPVNPEINNVLDLNLTMKETSNQVDTKAQILLSNQDVMKFRGVFMEYNNIST